MYEELIAALRFCDGGECDGCCRYKKEHGAECYTLLRDAADAIEELTGFVQEAERDRDEYRERLDKANDVIVELSKPRWIPVTERLPQEREWVLCQCRAKIRMVLRLQNGYWHQDSRHEFMSGFVTHWMQLPLLPEPPKEEV